MRQEKQRSNPSQPPALSSGWKCRCRTAPVRPGTALFSGIVLASFVAPLAYGHHPQETVPGPGTGFLHPFHGWDHLLAMLAIGVWSGRMGGRALLLVPAAFVCFLIGGALLAGLGAGAFVAEAGVLTSVLVLGILAIRAADAPLKVAIGWSGFFALFHGYAHGLETSLPAHPGYWLAFVAGTLVVHAAGVGLGLLWQRNRHPVRVPES